MSEQPTPNNSDDLIGRTLGQYEVLERIGKGGMATVYLAHQASIDRLVAIKLMPQHFLHDETFMQRFEREVRVIADLQHPRVLPVYDYGQFENLPYIVMAYVSGGTLEDRIKQGPISLEETVWFVRQIAEGLEHAHSKGIVHRDFKPSNVLLDEYDNVYLADFGIAKVSEATVELTGTGVVGTPAYMAPEVSHEGQVTSAADIYAMGITLYEMLSGTYPYHGETPLSVLMAHLTQPTPDVRELRPELPGDVTDVIQKAMAKKPRERYATPSALAEALEAAVEAHEDDEEELIAAQPVPEAPSLVGEAPAAEPTWQPAAAASSAPATPAAPPQKKRGGRWGVLLGIGGALIAALLLCVGAFIVLRGSGLFAPAPTETPALTATVTPPPPTSTTASTPTSVPETSGTVTLFVENGSGSPVCFVYISPAGEDQWSDDLLGSSLVLNSGSSLELTTVDQGLYDLVATDCDDRVIDDIYDANLNQAEMTWTIPALDSTLIVINQSSYTLCYVYVSPPEDATWGVDHMSDDEVIPSGEQIEIRLASGLWDFHTTTCDQVPYWEQYEVSISGDYRWQITDDAALNE